MYLSSILQMRGMLGATGSLEVTHERVRFVPSRWLDRVAGIGSDWEVPLLSIDRLVMQGRIDRRMVLGSALDEQTFSGRDLDAAREAIIHAHLRAQAEWGQARHPMRAATLLERWASVIGMSEAHVRDVKVCELGMIQGPARSARFGWLIVHEGLRFVPVGKPYTGDGHWYLPVHALKVPDFDDEQTLPLPNDRAFFPALGVVSLRRLRAAWRALRVTDARAPEAAPASSRRTAPRSRPLVPPAVTVKVREADGRERSVPGELQDLSLTGARVSLSEAVGVGASVTLEFVTLAPGRPFQGVTMHARPVPETEEDDAMWIVGMRFENVGAAEQLVIGKIIKGFRPSVDE